MSDRCARCGRALSLVSDDDVIRHRRSTGFASHRIEYFCSLRCRALAYDRDPVLLQTEQATLTAFHDDDVAEADRIAYGR